MISLRPAVLRTIGIAASLAVTAGFAIAADRSILVTAPSTQDAANTTPPGMTFIRGVKNYPVGLSLEQVEAIQERIKLSSPAELTVFAASYPLNLVDIAPFHIDTQEVTHREWMAYLKATDQKPSEDLLANRWEDGEIPEGMEDHPITFVSRDEAEAYAQWCGKRLPTEFEWEYAARGDDNFFYPWGNEFNDPDPRWDENGKRIPGKEIDPGTLKKGGERANCGPSRRGKREPHAVGEFELGDSSFGIQDMAGNVWEWTSSQMLAYPEHKPFTLKTHFGKEEISGSAFFSNNMAVIRGGCYDSAERAMMSVIRQPVTPDAWYSSIGFRCAKSARAGVETLEKATRQIGMHRFGNRATLDKNGMTAFERTTYDDAGMFKSFEGILFCQVEQWKDGRNRTLSMQKAQKETNMALGVLTTTHDMLVPQVPAGTYYVELRPSNTKAKIERGLKFPKNDWYYHGYTLDERSASSRKKDEEEEAEAEAKADKDDKADKADKDEEPEGEKLIEYAGSLKLNTKVHNVILIDVKGRVVAAYPVPKMKENGKLQKDGTPPAVVLDRKKVKADKRNKIPATERWTFDWIVKTSQKKGIPFSLPIRFAPDLLTPPAKSKSAEASDDATTETSDNK